MMEMTWANIITISRVVLSPLFLLFYLAPDWLGLEGVAWPLVLLLFLLLLELSDLTDGWIARRFNEVTNFGKIVDPMADTLTHLSVLLAFTAAPISLPVPLVFLFFYREIIIGALRTLAAIQGEVLAARSSGKLKTFLQGILSFYLVFCMLLWQMDLMTLSELQTAAFWPTLFVGLIALFSGFDYLWESRLILRHALKKH